MLTLNSPLCIYLYLFFLCIFTSLETAALSTEDACNNTKRLGVNTSGRLVVSYKNADFGDEHLQAYAEESRCDSEECRYIKLSNPFVNKNHPQVLKRAHYLIAKSVGDTCGLYVEPIHTENPLWDFSEKEDRALDYTVYLWVYNKHSELLFNQKRMRLDLLYFIPYLEIDDSIYVLSWNREDEVSGSMEIKNDAVEFPTKREKSSHVGMIISPMLKIKKDKDALVMESNVLGTQIHLQLCFRVFDTEGNAWILSWRNIKYYRDECDIESINIDF